MRTTPSRKRFAARSLAACSALLSAGFIAAGCVGCAGTSPQLSTPQMNTPTLPQPNVGGPPGGRGAKGGGPRATSAAEAKFAPLEKVATPTGTFVVEPYLQPGEKSGGKNDSLTVVWHDEGSASDDKNAAAAWTVETRLAGGAASDAWQKASAAPVAQTVTVGELKPHRVWRGTLTNLAPGSLFDYRILKGDKPVFAARARARKGAGESYRVALIGDCGAGSDGEKKVAYQIAQAKPDFLFITGDIVYDRGRASEYRSRFFPVLNADTAAPEKGAPLLRSMLTFAAPGNHDIAYRDLSRYPDGLAYFYYWSLPLNGPDLKTGANNTPSPTGGSDSAKQAFLTSSGPNYPRMANYSYDYGNTHWTVIDSNPYVNWSDAALRSWVEKDLAGAKNATWRFVAFHHPPFNSSPTHQEAQQMRVLCDVFEKNGVDMVWSGHVHNYQRTHPLRFKTKIGTDGRLRDDKGRVDGDWTLDKTFDGEKNTRPKGILYVITGGGGAGLYDKELQDKPDQWQPFTKKYIADKRSLTVVDVDGKSLTVRQLDEDGRERDKFMVTKP